MKQAITLLFVLALICGATAQAADPQAPDKPVQLKSAASSKMWVMFDHASHDAVACDVCHHAQPSDAASPYVSCGASEECHYIKGSKERDVQSLFWAYHTKNTERSCYGCHRTMVDTGCRPCHMSPQAREAAAKNGK
ncbi:MAG TPA: cytochrome c3 family protein [Candidatus Bilophila faecipullorum]|uniref:Cytochrome c3 family protein n=3 Tax=Bilophila TaxID=35832 RepID=A0A9D1R1G4_9BACT|nr:cytochrome c3 family protein [uncultured Bilophila sp.]HIW79224.1 cytochrome c3 family protein [Candidatus Bilophila faecipullorum]